MNPTAPARFLMACGFVARVTRVPVRRAGAAFAIAWLAAATVTPAATPPRLRIEDNVFGRPYVNTWPRPKSNQTNVTTHTTLYFEIVVPDADGAAGRVDPDTITATLVPSGGSPIPMLLAGQVFANGFSGAVIHGVDAGSNNGEGVYIVPASPLSPAKSYRVDVYAESLDGAVINPSYDSWSFTTRAAIASPTVSWALNLAGPTVHWNGWFFSGLLKPSFDVSRAFDQLDSYDLMSAVRAKNPDAWSLQRDWPMTSDYWHNGVFDGNPNPVRERETRRITAIQNQGPRTNLTVADLPEGPLYGIAPNRPLGADFHKGDLVTIADREKFEIAEVFSVDETSGIVKVSQLATPPMSWILNYPGSQPADNPDTPDNFTFPLCYLRKFSPVGTPVYYWSRIDDEWDIVVGQHDRRIQVNFSYTPLDLAREPVPASTGGHGSIGPPKDWPQWHEFVRQMVFHLIDRYGGARAQTFYYSVGNENNFSIFWSAGKDGFYELYDYTVNAVLTAFEDRGLDAGAVQVGGVEAAGLGGRGWIQDAMYHASGLAAKPAGGIIEQNFVCADARFDGLRAARVDALCAQWSGRGSPMDFVSIHEYEHADLAVADMTGVRDDALAMDPAFFGNLNVTCFECTPDWIPREDPASRAMYLGNGFFSAWASDWMQRMVLRAETDARYARHESVFTVWPFDYNGDGISSITGLMRVDDDADGTEDRIVTVKKEIFNWVEALASMNRELDALPAQTVGGIRLAGVRSRAADRDVVMLYAHDGQDTEAREAAVFTGNLTLSGIRWPHTTVRRFRVDRGHSSPYAAYLALPKKSLYAPGELAALEASDDLVEDGAPATYATPAGTLGLGAPVSVNGATFLELRERDLDGDGAGDTADNCPLTTNPSQANADGDPAGDACDCAPSDAGSFGAAVEVAGVTVAGAASTTIAWQEQATAAGPGMLYDLSTCGLQSLRTSGTYDAAACLAGNLVTPSFLDTGPGPPAGDGTCYLIRAKNACGSAGWGAGSGGVPRTLTACP